MIQRLLANWVAKFLYRSRERDAQLPMIIVFEMHDGLRDG